LTTLSYIFNYLSSYQKFPADAAKMNGDVEMQDADAIREEQIQYGHGASVEEEMNEK
jgi:hypothetical protein